MNHLCLFCYEETDRFIVATVGPFTHGFLLCHDPECMIELRMWFRPGVIMRGSQLWQ